jgi:hypothetical protein
MVADMSELRACRLGPDLCRFQTTSAETARALAQRKNARRVTYGVNRFLRIFQESMPLQQAKQLVKTTMNRKKTSMNKTRRKKERATANGASIQVKLQRGLYEVLRLLQSPFLVGFWAIEKRLLPGRAARAVGSGVIR